MQYKVKNVPVDLSIEDDSKEQKPLKIRKTQSDIENDMLKSIPCQEADIRK